MGALVALPGVAAIAWAFLAEDRWFETHMMVRYCIEQPSALVRAHVVRVLVALCGAAIVAFLRPVLVRHTSLGALGRSLVAALLAVVAADLVLRAAKPDEIAQMEEKRRSKRPAPRSTTEATIAGRSITFAIDAEGRRARTVDDVVDPAAPAIVLSGESVAFGHGLSFDETIQAQLAKRTGVAVVNLALDGLANDEALARLRERLPRLARPLAVVSFVVYSWLERNTADYRERLALAPDGSLVARPPAWPFLRRSPLLPRLYSLVGYHHDDEAIDLTRAILRDTDLYVRERGIYPLFVLTEAAHARCVRDGGMPWVAKRLVEGQRFAWVDVDVPPALVLPDDPHPNPEGALFYVDAIEKALREAGVLR